jgi:hypothetical protein
MPSASNTSNSSNIITFGNSIVVQQQVGSRLIVKLENQSTGFLAPGLTAGDVIRYDVSLQGYTRSSADSAPNSEVFGVVESRNNDGSLNVVTYGSIRMPSDHLVNLTGINFGGNDVYFLSAATAGYLQNLPPSNLGEIVKPVYQVAPNGSNYTGVVVNYVGYTVINQES